MSLETFVAPAESALRVLIVDDNVAIHRDFVKILGGTTRADEQLEALEQELFGTPKPAAKSRSEFAIDSAYQGDQAVELVKTSLAEHRPYALAFVDVRMPPGPDGIQTIAQMWRLDPNIQAVICTAYTDHTWDDIVHSLGHSDGLLVLRKPFDAVEALQTAHALGRKWLLAEQVRQRLNVLERLVGDRTQALEHANNYLKDEVEQRARAEDAFRYLATHDSLTGLPNRVLLNDRLVHALARAQRNQSSVALLLLDLDHFKDVNDTYGHAAGDALLKEMAERLTKISRASDTVTRMGGDEFVVLLEDLQQPEEAGLVAQRILAECSTPVQVLGHFVRTPPSIGVALYPHDCSDPESLLKSADLAMYHAKNSGRASYRFYAAGMFASSMEKVQMRDQLGGAVARNELTLWYQPLIDLRQGHVSSVEALLRWQHPELGHLAPLKFMPMAEATGLIIPIGAWVMAEACQQLAEWRRGASALTVAVNVSAAQLHAPDFTEMVLNTLDRAGLEGEALEIELTETTATKEPERAAQILQGLADHGIRIAIDDFGSGYSSFARLRDLPVHTLKIDHSLIRNVGRDSRDTAIIAAIVSVSRALGLTVVAEGVETHDQLEALKHLEWPNMGETLCDRAQGFFLSHPLPSEAATTLLLGGARPQQFSARPEFVVP